MDVNINDLTTADFKQGYKLGWQHRNDMGEKWEQLKQLRQEVAEQKKQIENLEKLGKIRLQHIQRLVSKLVNVETNRKTLRKELDAVKNDMTQMGRDIEYWRGSQQKAIEASENSGELERLRLEVVKLRTLNDGLLESSKRLRAFAKKVADSDWVGRNGYWWQDYAKQALSELDTANPAPASEPTGGAE